ncbi:MAG: MBL fold metallo-hydrolase [Gammaproteobacteria bacterium]|nr:MBL fold metallo-hydrolase [Gammaproteobacteria bacterium]
MDIEIFQSNKGDCILLKGNNGGRVLCDGGMAKSMREHVRAELTKLHENGEKLDAVYVSHIDQDHISGVLQLLSDLLSWRIVEHHRANGDNTVNDPDFERPPDIDGLWHNSFRDLIGPNSFAVQNLLAATAPVLFGTGVSDAMALGERMHTIAVSIPEALKVSRLAKPDLLNIPINVLPNQPGPAKLLMIRGDNMPFNVGSLEFHLIGPAKDELTKLRDGWNNWLRDNDNRARTREIRKEMQKRVEEFATGVRTGTPFDLGDWNGIPDFEGVTVPNIASLMFLVKENGKTLLLTGDCQQDILLQGLTDTGHMDAGHIHVDVLKVQHHGSEHNADPDFCRRVSADHYIFCGNGMNGNPEKTVLEMFFNSRLGDPADRALAPEAANREFTFWFSTTANRQSPGSTARTNFEETEQVVNNMLASSNGQMHANFNNGNSITLSV